MATEHVHLFNDGLDERAGSEQPHDLADDLIGGLAVFARAPLEVRDVVLDPVFARRRDALLRSVPVHDLVARAERADSGIASFDTRALVLAAFDAVIARQGFPDRTSPDQVTTLLAGIAAIQCPDGGSTAYAAVAEHVLDGLTNRRERERQFTLTSIVYAPGVDGSVAATAVPRPFWLLREAEDPHTGSLYLECSTDAVNALVGGLDIPIEDQQIALETVLERQLARGELDAAHATAIQARRLTAGYLVQVEELLAETERYLPGTDWRVAAPRLLSNALDHISECLAREGRLLDHVAGGIADKSPADISAERRIKISAALTKLLSESRHLHTQLMERLIGARGRFLDAQDSQMFRPVLSTVEFDLRTDLLEPVLALHVVEVEAVAEAYLRAALGPKIPAVLHWGDFVEALIHEPRSHADDGPEATDEDLTFRPDPEPLVSRELLDVAHRVLARISLPARLSTLLGACPAEDDLGASAQDLFVAATLRGYDNSVRDSLPAENQWDDGPDETSGLHAHRRAPGDLTPGYSTDRPVHLLEILGPDAACISDGTPLDGGTWDGDDLIVCVDLDQADAVLLGELTRPAPTRLRPSLRGVRS
ncbi:MAG: hypothetical protein ACRCZD_06820 [Phycicoccus sp.]